MLLHHGHVAQGFGLAHEFVNHAAAAVLAEEAVVVHRGGTRLRVAQTLRDQQQTAVAGDAGQRLAPGLVVHEDADER